MHKEKAIEVAGRLVAWADIIVEGHTPKAMKKWGLAYEDLVKIKPDIIMLRSTMLGLTGPQAERPGYGTILQASAGVTHFNGWPDRPPAGSCAAFTDFIVPPLGVVAIMAAIDYRQKTGKGQLIDIAQMEASLHYLAPVLLDYTVNEKNQNRRGNRCPYAAPHGVYACKGEDRWCAIGVFTDEEWKSFCKVIGNQDWTKYSRFKTLLSRKENEDELNRLVSEWTINHSPEKVMHLMQDAGVAAGIVQKGEDLHQDSHLKARNYFWELNHPVMGPCTYDGLTVKLSKTPGELRTPAPTLGEHNAHVYTKVLGMSDEEFVDLLEKGVFE